LKDNTFPLFRVKARWDHSIEDPKLRIGCFEFSVPNKYTTLPFNTSNKEVYSIANKFALLVNRNMELRYQLQFDRQKLYNDITEAKRDHYRYIPRPEVERELRTSTYNWREAEDWKRVAEQKALSLLSTVTEPEFAERITQNHPFYFRPGNGPHYIIDPGGKNVIRLDEPHPVGLCIYLADPEVQSNRYDWAIAIYLYLRGAQDYLHESANEYRYLRYAEWKKEEVNLKERTSSEGMIYV